MRLPEPRTTCAHIRVPIGGTAPADPPKRRHRRHLLSTTGVTNDDVFEAKKLSKQLSSPSTLTNDDASPSHGRRTQFSSPGQFVVPASLRRRQRWECADKTVHPSFRGGEFPCRLTLGRPSDPCNTNSYPPKRRHAVSALLGFDLRLTAPFWAVARKSTHLFSFATLTPDGVLAEPPIFPLFARISSNPNPPVRPWWPFTPRKCVRHSNRRCRGGPAARGGCYVQSSTPTDHFVLYIRRASLRHKDYGNALARSRWRAIGRIRSRNLAREHVALTQNRHGAAREALHPPSPGPAALRKCTCENGFGRSNSFFPLEQNDN